MRRVVETTEAAPHGGGASTVMPRRRLLPLALFAAACYAVAPYLGLDSFAVDPRIAEVWPAGGVGFVLLTAVWSSGRRAVAATVGYMVLVFASTSVLLGQDLSPSLWMGLLSAGQSLLMTAIYRYRLGHPGWAPERPADLANLLLAALGSSLLLAGLGGFPRLGLDELGTQLLWWWVLRSTVFCFVGGVTFMVIFHARQRGSLTPSPWSNRLALLAVTLPCIYGSYHAPTLPLSWLLIIPSVWGGLTLTVRGAAYLALGIALIAASMTYLPANQFGYDGLLPPASIMDLLVIVSCGLTLLLALLREQRASLIGELERRRMESEGRRRMLETVFDSMSDGVVIVDDERVSMYNAAARQLLGRPIPADIPVSWAREFGLTDGRGRPVVDEDLRTALTPTPDDPRRVPTLELHVGQDDARRVVELSAQQLGEADDASTLVLLHDVTAQRARLRELSDFAGMVAHDLRGPLTVLHGWLEVVEDGDPVRDAGLVHDAVRKASDSSRRMRQVIDDWLNYAVVQNGELRPQPVELLEVSAEIVDGRRTTGAGSREPEFVLDVEHSVHADPGLLRQLLDNLVGNAIKYTPREERPWVRISSQQDDEDGWVRVDVADRGVGVPAGEEERIFDAFHRGPAEGRSPGTGLGLALTRRIVALHGGQLRASRNPGRGSTFSFTLPAG